MKKNTTENLVISVMAAMRQWNITMQIEKMLRHEVSKSMRDAAGLVIDGGKVGFGSNHSQYIVIECDEWANEVKQRHAESEPRRLHQVAAPIEGQYHQQPREKHQKGGERQGEPILIVEHHCRR